MSSRRDAPRMVAMRRGATRLRISRIWRRATSAAVGHPASVGQMGLENEARVGAGQLSIQVELMLG